MPDISTVIPGTGRPKLDSVGQTVSPAVAAFVRQAAAICLREAACKSGFEVLLIASRGSGEWGLPKGHVEPGETSYQTALREAYEEVGVVGEVEEAVLDTFRYRKPDSDTNYRVAVHLLSVSRTLEEFPESGWRTMQWVPLRMASRWIANVQLAGILDMAFHSSMLKAHSA
ncbi:MAG: NUDIX domain-containing protein [Sphingomonadales bacterium]|nr:NUDIX domain-containing protein [Sphingomonadales bacterium]MDE2170906.1 NUDIX domain-containing protein [Sphingomonadales bacterium]